MKHLKTSKEVYKVISTLSKSEKLKLRKLISDVFHDGHKESFDMIDEDFIYPNRWRLFDNQTDSEILYESDQINEFIDICIGAIINKEL